MVKASETGGVKPMSIAGRFIRERERLLGMSDEERKWRAQWLKDQQLTPNEPKHVPELYKEKYNFIRRAYKAPLDKLASVLEPTLGHDRTVKYRYFTGKFFLGLYLTLGAFYYFKYNSYDWTYKGGWKVMHSRKSVLPGDPNWPEVSDKKPNEYADFGFSKNTLNL
ncbi:uncharacterized protein LOC108736705 [Agrilus planipennis]|uniref:Uncharacterized protein LOC108736705 n=1 Tax=Agrilus planipennis TaxID=224129 RepID=A0A1W4WW49_AGRPL|nr:uncharacterized protein LOC108736705 [Agrilus planipennis]